MKKTLILFTVCLFYFVVVAPALADWSVTVTWTHSVGPNLQNEKVFLDGVEQCNVLGTNPATCNFIVTDLMGQAVSIVSYNTQSTPSDSYDVGTLLVVPAPPSGPGLINITQVP